MSPLRKLPYYTPHADRIHVHAWQMYKTHGVMPLPSVLPGWDPAVNIKASTKVTLDVHGIWADCELADDSVLQLGASWESRGTRLSGLGTSVQVTAGANTVEHELSVSILGTMISQSVHLAVSLSLLAGPREPQAQFVPTTVGSRLATYGSDVIVGGIGPRFPIEVIDFESTRYPSAASWALFWDPTNLEQTIDGDIRLYINLQNSVVVRAITENRPDDSGIREALRYDIAQQLIFGLLCTRLN